MIRILQSIILLLLIAILLPVAYEVWHQRPAFESNTRKLDALLSHAERTMKSTDEAVTQWNLASKAQIKESTNVLTETGATLAQLQKLASNMDVSLSTLLAQSQQAIVQQNQSLLLTQEELRKSLIEMNRATIQLQATLAGTQKLIEDPSIPQSLASIQDSLKQLDAATTDVRQIADKARETYLKPANLWLAVAKGLISAGGSVAQMVK